MSPRRLAPLLLAALLLAGCTAGPQLPSLDSTIQLALDSKAKDYHWPPLAVTNAAGEPATASTAGWPRAVEQMLPQEGSDPTLGVDSQGTLFVTTFDRLQASTDQGRTWATVHTFESLDEPTLPDRFTTLYATQWIDAANDAIFLAHLNVGIPAPGGNRGWCPQVTRSLDGGKTWHNTTSMSWPASCTVPSSGYGFTGLQAIFTAKPGPNEALAHPLQSYPDVVYYCHILFLPVVGVPHCWESFDGADTFVQAGVIPIDPNVPCQSTSLGRPAVYADGTVALPIFAVDVVQRSVCPPRVALSRDDGVTWTVSEMPVGAHAGSVERNPQIAITTDGTAYFVYRDPTTAVYAARSTDRFATWSAPLRIAPATHALDFQPTVVAGSPGRVAFAYLGTTQRQDKQGRGIDPDTNWHLFLTTSFDADQTDPSFVTQQVTPDEDPVQVGCVGGGGGSAASTEHGCSNLSFQMNGGRDPSGRVYVAFVDGCTPRNDCTRDAGSGGFQAQERNAAVAVVDGGASLLAEKGLLPSLGLVPPEPRPQGG